MKAHRFSYLSRGSGSKYSFKFGKESLTVLPSLSSILASCGAIHGSATWAQTTERTEVKSTPPCSKCQPPYPPSYPKADTQGVARGHPRNIRATLRLARGNSGIRLKQMGHSRASGHHNSSWRHKPIEDKQKRAG